MPFESLLLPKIGYPRDRAVVRLEPYQAKISLSSEPVTILMWLSTATSYQYVEDVPVDLVVEVQLTHERMRLSAPGCVQSPVATVHSLYPH